MKTGTDGKLNTGKVGKKEKHVGKKVKGKQARRREEEGETAWKQRKKNAIAAVVVMFCTHTYT